MVVIDWGDTNSRLELVSMGEAQSLDQNNIDTVLSSKEYVNAIKHMAYMQSVLAQEITQMYTQKGDIVKYF